jgi:hypothetical protein
MCKEYLWWKISKKEIVAFYLPCNFYMVSLLKDKLYRNNPRVEDDLK